MEKINKLLDIKLAQDYSMKGQQMEMIKLAVRGSSIQYAARKQKAKRNQISVLEKKLTFWQKQTDIGNLTIDKSKALHDIKKDLENIYAEKTRGAMLRCRTNWVEFAGKLTKYFLNLEKSNYNKKCIQRLRSKEDGQIITERQAIQKELDSYFTKLYTSKIAPDLDYVKKGELPQLGSEQKEMLDAPVTLEELGQALKDLKSNKAPGADGIPVEFWKFFWGKLKHFFLDLVQEVIEKGKLHLSARRGILSLIEKLGKDVLDLDCWRPISLLCSDYKIISKLIANRLQSVLPQIIHESQVGFMKGKNIGENTLKLTVLIEFCEYYEQSGIIISFDYRKAFDTLEWPAIFHTMKCFDFGNNFIDMVKILYNDIYGTVINNSFWGEWYKLSCSTRQGCPLSALIFNLVAEVIGTKICSSVKIKGLEMFDFEFKSEQYVDDIWVGLDPTEQNINKLLDEMHNSISFQDFKSTIIK